MNSFICYLFGIYALPAKKHDPVILFRKLVRIQILVGSIDLVNLTKWTNFKGTQRDRQGSVSLYQTWLELFLLQELWQFNYV